MRFNIYKRSQAKDTRLWSGVLVFAIVAVGCFVLHSQLQVYDNIWVEVMIPLGLCTGIGLFIFWFSNRPTVADFLISAESEIKKVSWSSRREIMVSTTIVIIVVSLIAALIRCADLLFAFVLYHPQIINILNK